jgi:hypothetical protein
VLRLLKSSTQSLVLVVNKAFGDKTHGESQSDEIGTNEQKFIMAVVSAMNAIRGKVKEFFSDIGTNFIGGAKELGIPAICVEDRTLKTFLNDQGTVWKFNTPYSSHMGGSWERLETKTVQLELERISIVWYRHHEC